jgi:hypothetical protein
MVSELAQELFLLAACVLWYGGEDRVTSEDAKLEWLAAALALFAWLGVLCST